LIHDLTEGQTFANNMSEFYAQEQTIESLKKQIKDLTEMVVKNMNNQQ
jgi:hypothetical protein